MNLNQIYFLISLNISADLKGPKVKYNLHYGRCTGPLFRGATPKHRSILQRRVKNDGIVKIKPYVGGSDQVRYKPFCSQQKLARGVIYMYILYFYKNKM